MNLLVIRREKQALDFLSAEWHSRSPVVFIYSLKKEQKSLLKLEPTENIPFDTS